MNYEQKDPRLLEEVGDLSLSVKTNQNGTSVENIWTYPVSASGFQNYTGTAPVARETNSYGWYSLWFPSQTGSPNIIQFLRP